jgi:hypothetical protein
MYYHKISEEDYNEKKDGFVQNISKGGERKGFFN